MAKAPKVSILCLTYNQDEYIKQTLDGFLMQKTDFDFEVLINDDASTDNTQKILKEYAEKYPEIIKPNFQNKNLYSQGLRNFIPRFLLPKAQGKYLAVCEGDDYWTDPDKLQTQADFLDNNPDYVICFHAVRVTYENSEDKEFIFPDVKDENWYTTEELLRTNYIPTNAVMYRKQKYLNIPTDISPGDWFLHLYHAQFGKIKFIDKVMSVYRKHEGGIWWDYDKDVDAIWRKHGIAHLSMHNELMKMYGKNEVNKKIIEGNIHRLLEAFIRTEERYHEGLLRGAMIQFPEHCQRFVLAKQQELAAKSQELKAKEKEVDDLWSAVRKQDEIIEHKTNEIERLETTKLHKLRNIVAKDNSKERAKEHNSER